jgi:hypothetical protein
VSGFDLGATAVSDSATVILDAIGDCDGYRVVSSEGYLGSVEAVLYGAESRPAALAIRSGLFSRELLIVAVEDVCEISSERKMLVLGELSGSEVTVSD